LPETRIAPRGHSFAFGLAALELSGCADLVRHTRMIVSGCGGVSIGVVHSVVYDLLPVQPGDHIWAGASAEARWRITLIAPVAVEIGAGALVPLTRYQFLVQGPLGVVYEQSPVAFVATVGLGVQIP
jgi:hypothetical protein